MDNDQIKQIALECGFKLNGETDGEPDLRDYVYKFAKRISLESKDVALNSVTTEINNNYANNGIYLEPVNEISQLIATQQNTYLNELITLTKSE